MNRRSFLKRSAACMTMLSISNPFILSAMEYVDKPDIKKSDLYSPPNLGQFGSYVYITCRCNGFNDPIFKEAYSILRKDLLEIVPKSKLHKVEWIIINPKPTAYDPLAQQGIIGWKYTGRRLK